ncbi:hypothetical protein EBZ80_14195 [bacterium]|nr:hypothetical protein [bacterium]
MSKDDMAYLQFYDPSINARVCAPSPLCDKGYLTDSEKEMYVLHNLWPVACSPDPSCSYRFTTNNVPPSSLAPSLPFLPCTSSAVAQCQGSLMAPPVDDSLVYLDRNDASTGLCLPVKTGYGFSSDICYVGAGNPCHLPVRGAVPRACADQCCVGNKTPDPVPSSGPCTYKRPCYDARRNDTRYDCAAGCSSNQACFVNVADAYSYTRSFLTPANALPPCTSGSHSFYA